MPASLLLVPKSDILTTPLKEATIESEIIIKMNKYAPVSVDKHIVPFDVPVHNLLVVEIFQTLSDEK